MVEEPMTTTFKILVTLTALIFGAGCAGEFDLSADPDSTQVLFPGGEVDENGNIVTPGTANPEGESVPLTPAFQIEKNEVRLLPFHIRMAKLSRVVNLPVEDPIFDEVMAHRYDLGDHNYGQSVGPDLSWNASKISVWVDAIRPVCASEAMALAYPTLPEELNALLLAAYGREATTDDLADYDAVLADVTLSDAERYEAVCLAVLTSSEFVAQ